MLFPCFMGKAGCLLWKPSLHFFPPSMFHHISDQVLDNFGSFKKYLLRS